MVNDPLIADWPGVEGVGVLFSIIMDHIRNK